ncbi:MAG: hypothetical protein J6Q41_07680 [Firmicutes bacterium]|nr:hypothetical protein [Bacillota bacterium]
MEKFWQKIQRWWYFYLANPVVAKGERGGFKYKFRRFWLEIETVSGNWKMRSTASENPYGYLMASVNANNEDNVYGFAEILYMLQALLTVDQKLVDDVRKALNNYEKRSEGVIPNNEDEIEEKIALEEVRQVQEYVDAPKKERRKMERDANGRFKKAVKEAEKAEI